MIISITLVRQSVTETDPFRELPSGRTIVIYVALIIDLMQHRFLESIGCGIMNARFGLTINMAGSLRPAKDVHAFFGSKFDVLDLPEATPHHTSRYENIDSGFGRGLE